MPAPIPELGGVAMAGDVREEALKIANRGIKDNPDRPSVEPRRADDPEDKSNAVPWLGLLVGVTLILFFVLQVDRVIDNNLTEDVVVDDVNITFEHTQLAGNQALILAELRVLNSLSDCVIDTDSIQTGSIPVEGGGTRNVSIIPFVCPVDAE